MEVTKRHGDAHVFLNQNTVQRTAETYSRELRVCLDGKKLRVARKWSQATGGARKPWAARSKCAGSKEERAIRRNAERATRTYETSRAGGASAGVPPSIHRCIGVREGVDGAFTTETETMQRGIESEARMEGVDARASAIPMSWRTIGQCAPILRQQDIAAIETESRVMSVTETTVRAQGAAVGDAPAHRIVTSASATAGPSD